VPPVPKKISTREKIILAARKAFAKKGHDGVSMSEIAENAGVKKALIYYYFPSKEDLFYEVWQYSLDELENHIFAEIENENAYLKKIKKLLKAYIDFITSKKEVRQMLLQEKGNFTREDERTWQRIKDRYLSLRKRISSLIEQAKLSQEINASVDPEGAAELILNGLSSTDNPKSIETVKEIIWRGLIVKE